MMSRSRLAVCAVSATAATLVLASGGTGLADPPNTLVSPPNHRHFLVKPDGGLVPIGPQICGNPDMQQAFNLFHHNIHHSDGSTLGPQGGAPGLHNRRGAEVIGIRGCG